jgi:DNA-binding HxlR family transcriptional regulator
VELVGRRWTGAILRVLMDGPLRFSQIAQAVPELSDRLLSERMKELEARGIVERQVHEGSPARVEYSLTDMGRELAPALRELRDWALRWL